MSRKGIAFFVHEIFELFTTLFAIAEYQSVIWA